ncbi:hypothetical protein BSKO_05299 [Bryopsis sp. KO-2023]|nr:hypothetical protein BSKO_05299 [Bryopsis sp. KO-2023]
MTGKKLKKGTRGTAVNYLTRGDALKKLQVSLKTFRRLCILKGIHPREPRKKLHGADKTYYHAKDIKWLMHERLLSGFRRVNAFEKKIKKQIGRQNMAAARRLKGKRPALRLDHLIKERYPSFIDAVRDLDDPLTMVHLFSVLPSTNSEERDIPVAVVVSAKRLAMEFDAYVVKTHSLRKVFVSVRGFYYQAEIMGQNVTWLTPHRVQQVLPTDIDYSVMSSFMEFYRTLLRFVNFKLYNSIGLKYPPSMNPELQKEAAYLESIISEFSKPREEQVPVKGPSSEDVKKRLAGIQDKIKEIAGEAAAGKDAEGSDSELEEIFEEEEEEGDANNTMEIQDNEEEEAGKEESEDDGGVKRLDEKEAEGERAAGATANVAADDEAALCANLFRGLVFFLGRECPMEPLLFVIRAFGGKAGWMGEGSPLQRTDDAITHEICDRPTVQGGLTDGRNYVQPQWVFDSCNARVLLPTEPYSPGKAPPPHLSPFVNDDEEGYVPDYAKTIRSIQEAANMVRQTVAGPTDQELGDDGDLELEELTEIEKAEAQEKAYLEELAQEITPTEKEKPPSSSSSGVALEEGEQAVMHGDGGKKSPKKSKKKKGKKRSAKEVAEESRAMNEIMIPRKHRHMYNVVKSGEEEHAAKVQKLSKKRDALKKKGRKA